MESMPNICLTIHVSLDLEGTVWTLTTPDVLVSTALARWLTIEQTGFAASAKIFMRTFSVFFFASDKNH